uniref:Uncharacterized protein n=1 Tax=Spongospora subterranea TaxID=70186 RepID=A0A0H5RAL0_9EUKA|eukprot:CRZ05499.1 hypothetical protein [Spongospora subterranea]
MSSTAGNETPAGCDDAPTPGASRMPRTRPTFNKFVMYETTIRFYVIAHCPMRSTYRVMKIDRTDPPNLSISVIPNEFTRDEVYKLLDMLNAANINSGGLLKCVTACAILGFIQTAYTGALYHASY